MLFSRIFNTDFPPVLHLVLGLSVWCIYLADRLHDALRTDSAVLGTGRLMFTKKRFKPLASILLVASALNLALIILHVPGKLIATGLITAALLGVYYLLRLKAGVRIAALIPREILCGLIFALGCVITPHAFAAPGGTGPVFWISAFCLGLVCSANCILISIWEREEDLAASDTSMASAGTVRHIGIVIVGIGVASMALAFAGARPIHLAIALSAGAQWITLQFDDRLPKPLLRMLADAVLLTPLLLLWV